MSSERYRNLIQLNARQVASSLVQARAAAMGVTTDQTREWRIEASQLHFHDDSTTEIAWNDVEAITMFNEHSGESIPVPLMASEGYSSHGHTGPYDGGYVSGLGPHDHRDNYNGGFCFAILHSGTSLPQQPWSV
jgi:hypothetical protein